MHTDPNGNDAANFSSLPFGDGGQESGSNGYAGWDFYRFGNLDFDGPSYTYHAQFREFNPTQGRWLSSDPYGGSYDFTNPQSFNRYGYVLNDPLSMADPRGLDGGNCGWVCDTPVGFIFCIFFCGGGGGGSFHGSLHPRPNAQPWDEYHIHYGANIADALGLPDAGCEFGACGPGVSTFSGGGADPASKVQGLYGQILEHLEKIAESPDSQYVNHWRTEVQGWARQILDKANKVNLKRRPGAVDTWLERVIGVGSEDLQRFLRIGDIWVVNPCLTIRDPLYQQQMCGGGGGM